MCFVLFLFFKPISKQIWGTKNWLPLHIHYCKYNMPNYFLHMSFTCHYYASRQISYDFHKGYMAFTTHATSLLIGMCHFNILPQRINYLPIALQIHSCTNHDCTIPIAMVSDFFPTLYSATSKNGGIVFFLYVLGHD